MAQASKNPTSLEAPEKEIKDSMDDLFKSWNIGKVNAIEPISSYWGKTSLVKTTDGHGFILKEKSDISQIEQEFLLLSSLSEVGAPVAAPIRTVTGEGYASSKGKIFCLYPKLPGKVIEEHYGGNAEGRAKAFGEAIGLLHKCFLKCASLIEFRELKLIG